MNRILYILRLSVLLILSTIITALLMKESQYKSTTVLNLLISLFTCFDFIILYLLCKKLYISAKMKKRIAYHEAGHAVLIHLGGYHRIEEISIKQDFYSLGHVNSTDKDCDDKTQKKLINNIQILLAGKASEKIFFGCINSFGYLQDECKARREARNLLYLYGDINCTSLADLHSNMNSNIEEIKRMDFNEENISKIMNEIYEMTRYTLIQNANLVKTIAEILLENKKILDISNLI